MEDVDLSDAPVFDLHAMDYFSGCLHQGDAVASGEQNVIQSDAVRAYELTQHFDCVWFRGNRSCCEDASGSPVFAGGNGKFISFKDSFNLRGWSL